MAASIFPANLPQGRALAGRERRGGMAEWLKALAWKACIRATVSWVRIPLPPPTDQYKLLKNLHFSPYLRRLAPRSTPRLFGPVEVARSPTGAPISCSPNHLVWSGRHPGQNLGREPSHTSWTQVSLLGEQVSRHIRVERRPRQPGSGDDSPEIPKLLVGANVRGAVRLSVCHSRFSRTRWWVVAQSVVAVRPDRRNVLRVECQQKFLLRPS